MGISKETKIYPLQEAESICKEIFFEKESTVH